MKQLITIYLAIVSFCPLFGQLSGVYTIDPSLPNNGNNYITFAEALKDLKGTTIRNGPGISGDVIFNIADGTHGINIKINDGADSIHGLNENHGIKFKSSSGNREKVNLVSGSIPAINLEGISDVTFEDVSITTSTGNGGNIIHLFNTSKISIINTVIESFEGSSQNLINSGTYGLADNITIKGNLLKYGENGIIFRGGIRKDSIKIMDNHLLYQKTSGINITETSSLEISNNYTVSGDSSLDNYYSIFCDDADSSLRILNNKVIANVGTSALHIINCNGSIDKSLIANNFFSYKGSTGFAPAAISIWSSAKQKLYNNSVYTEDSISTALLIVPTTGLSIFNNIFYNAGKGYCIISYLDGIDSSDNNAFYTEGSYLASWNSNQLDSLLDWQIATGQDQNSIFTPPLFTSTTNLHTCNTILDSSGIPLSEILIDIDGQDRDNSFPDIGADEFSSNQLPIVELEDTIGLCLGDSIIVSPAVTYSFLEYAWDRGDSTSTILVDTAGLYIIEAINACSFKDIDSIFVKEKELPMLDLGDDGTFCQGKILDAGAGMMTYRWYKYDFALPGLVQTGDTTQTFLLNELGNSTMVYKAEVIGSNGCEQSDTIIINAIRPNPLTTLGKDTFFCNNGSISLTGGTLTAAEADYIWSTGESNTQSIIIDTPGTYSVKITNIVPPNCTSFDTINIRMFPETSITSDPKTCPDSSVELTATGGLNYSWSPSIGLNDTTASTVTLHLADTGNFAYVVTIEDTNGCVGTESVSVTIIDSCSKNTNVNYTNNTNLFSTAIFPNPSNGIFTIQLVGVNKDYYLQVSDLYGKVVFKKSYVQPPVAYSQKLDLEYLPSGIYNILLQVGEQRSFQQFSIVE